MLMFVYFLYSTNKEATVLTATAATPGIITITTNPTTDIQRTEQTNHQCVTATITPCIEAAATSDIINI